MNIGDFARAIRNADRILTTERRLTDTISRLAADLDDLKARIIRLENREDLVIVEARAAAGTAASAVVSANIADLASRLTRLEERKPSARRLPKDPQ